MTYIEKLFELILDSVQYTSFPNTANERNEDDRLIHYEWIRMSVGKWVDLFDYYQLDRKIINHRINRIESFLAKNTAHFKSQLELRDMYPEENFDMSWEEDEIRFHSSIKMGIEKVKMALDELYENIISHLQVARIMAFVLGRKDLNRKGQKITADYLEDYNIQVDKKTVKNTYKVFCDIRDRRDDKSLYNGLLDNELQTIGHLLNGSEKQAYDKIIKSSQVNHP